MKKVEISSKNLPLKLYEKTVKKTMEEAKNSGDMVIAVVTATKPDFYKQWSLLPAAEKAGLPHFVINTGQHYDEVLGHGLKEFGIEDKFAVDLCVRGELLQKSSELITKIGWFGKYLKDKWPDVTVLPVVHGDTLVAGVAPIGWMFSRNERAAQNEAGLRGMTADVIKKIPVDIDAFIEKQWNDKWFVLRNEPFPEQWDTFVSGAGCEFHFAPHEINKEHLIKEGYPKDRIWVVGNSVVDAVALKRKEKSDTSVFDEYPKLEKGDWIRVDIHRRENLTERRFKSIIQAVLKLVDKGYNIAFVELNATRKALEYYGLRGKLLSLKKANFLFTGVWPEYSHVIEFLESGKCFAELTDSGSMQEELNEIKKTLCLTCRFTTDRPETVMFAHTNVLVPPLNSGLIVRMVEHIYDSQHIKDVMSHGKKLYGENVGEKIIEILSHQNKNFRWAHEVLGFWEEKSRFDYL